MIGLMTSWKHFREDRRGTLTAFVLINFIMMVLVAGIAVDIVRYEQQRACFQSVVDSGVLAATSLRQTRDYEDIVEDALNKSDCRLNYSVNVDVDDDTYTTTLREVSADVQARFDTFFLKFLGYDTFSMAINAEAEEGNPYTEISLVLDTSGSMGWEVPGSGGQTKLDAMQIAAKEFVTTMLSSNASVSEPRVSISIVSYATKVNVGTSLAEAIYGASTGQDDCILVDDDAFSTLGVSTTTSRRQSDFAIWYPDSVSELSYERRIGLKVYDDSQSKPYCKVDSSNFILPFSSDETVLHNYIDNLVATGATSIDDGVYWGANLLDPNFNTHIQAMNSLVTDNDGDGIETDPDVDNPQYVIDTFADRPSVYESTDPNVRVNNKILVVMTDGENTNHWHALDTSNNFSGAYIKVDGDNNAERIRYTNNDPDGSGTEWFPLSNWALWDNASAVHYLLNNNLPLTYTEVYKFADQKDSDDKDTRLQAICDAFNGKAALMEEGALRTYTIAYNAPPAGQTAMANCASTPGYYQVATPETISAVFEGIVASIEKLKLIK